MKIAITGKIAAGKSFVVKEIDNILWSYYFVSADDLAKHFLTSPEFKTLLIAEHGTCEPSELRQFISSSTTLNMITQRVIKEIEEILTLYENVVVEAPTLFNHPQMIPRFDKILFITTTPELQMERLRGRGYDDMTIETFLAAQLFDEYDKRITHVIKNLNNPDYLNEQLVSALTPINVKPLNYKESFK